jgi:glycosyltransferase involved in cell wall biosynthesis
VTRKLRLLARSEATFLSSGYAVYYKNLLDRLYATNKFCIAEHASYCTLADQRTYSIPWRVYPNAPEPNDQAGIAQHNADGFAQFGGWRYEDVVLDFKPDIVFDISDSWYCTHLFSSPFRPLYKIAYMPTVDGEPQATDWIGQMMEADCLFTYTEWAKCLLENQTGGSLKILSANPPGGDFKTFNPILDKQGLKAKFGFGKNINIVGTVMRNQARKLFPDLFQAFRKFLDYCEKSNKDLGQRTYLYCHTSYPDLGWNLPLILQEENIMHKVLFTYLCRNCHNIFVELWADSRVFCPHCGQPGATLPNTQHGISPEQLGVIYNLMDLYVQPVSSEGFGIPCVEAASCGIPLAVTNYSGTIDFINKCKAYPIELLSKSRDVTTHTHRAKPDPDSIVDILIKFFSLPESLRKKRGFDTRKCVEKHFNWEETTKKWMAYFDSVEPIDWRLTWKSPPKLHNPVTTYPSNISMSQMVDWAIVNVLGMPEKLNTYFALNLVKSLTYGGKIVNGGNMYINDFSMVGIRPTPEPFQLNNMLQQLFDMRNNINNWEKVRCGIENREKPYYITHAKPDSNIENHKEFLCGT